MSSHVNATRSGFSPGTTSLSYPSPSPESEPPPASPPPPGRAAAGGGPGVGFAEVKGLSFLGTAAVPGSSSEEPQAPAPLAEAALEPPHAPPPPPPGREEDASGTCLRMRSLFLGASFAGSAAGARRYIAARSSSAFFAKQTCIRIRRCSCQVKQTFARLQPQNQAGVMMRK